MLPFNRVDIADAYVVASKTRPELRKRIQTRAKRVRDLSNESDHFYGSVWEAIDCLEPTARPHYFALVAKLDGQPFADKLRTNYERIDDPAGVTIQVENSDDDPTMVNFHVADVIADAWADRHGSLDGGTWEATDDDGTFVYDSTYWSPGLFERLEKEGYNFDFSTYGEPDERDLEVARHASECEECEYDWHKADKHLLEKGETGDLLRARR